MSTAEYRFFVSLNKLRHRWNAFKWCSKQWLINCHYVEVITLFACHRKLIGASFHNEAMRLIKVERFQILNFYIKISFNLKIICIFESAELREIHQWTPKYTPSTRLCCTFLKTFASYIHNWSLQPISQDYWPSFSHHLCWVC